MPRIKKVKKSSEQHVAELWEIAMNLRTNGQKVDVVVQCDEMNVPEVNILLAKTCKLFATKPLKLIHKFQANEWRLIEHDGQLRSGN